MNFRLLQWAIFPLLIAVNVVFAQDPDFGSISIDPIEDIVIDEVHFDVEAPTVQEPMPAKPVPQPVPPKPVEKPSVVQPVSQPVVEPQTLTDSPADLEQNVEDESAYEDFDVAAGAGYENVDATAEADSFAEPEVGLELFCLFFFWIVAAVVSRSKKAVMFYDERDYGLSARLWGALLVAGIAMSVLGESLMALVIAACVGVCFLTIFRIFAASIRYNKSVSLGLVTTFLKMSLCFLTIPLYFGVLLFNKLQTKKNGCISYPLSLVALIFGGLGMLFMNGKEFYAKKGWNPPKEKK